MSAENPWIDDEPGGENSLPATEAQPSAPIEPSPLGLPRLQIVHLLAWTAAIAVAFLPYRAQHDLVDQMQARAGAASRAPSVAEVGSAFGGILSGTYLFVTASLFYWKQRGRKFRRQPGHVLALQGATTWAASVFAVAVMTAVDARSPFAFLFFSVPPLIVGLVFFVWFLIIAARRDEPPRWRWTFAILALVPVLAYVAMILFSFTFAYMGSRSLGGVRSTMPMILFIALGLPAVLQTAALSMAMVGDWRQNTPRHWSHWIGAVARLSTAVIQLASAVLMALLMPW